MSEIILDSNIFITSKTDLKGNILYCNQEFLKYAGYNEEETLFKPHNLVRHEDMPRSVFKILWNHIKRGEEVFAFVKNKTKNNDYYWVFANVTPNYDANNCIVGYYSVRRKANPKAIDAISNLYAQVLQIELQKGLKEAQEYILNASKSLNLSYNHFIINLQRNGNAK